MISFWTMYSRERAKGEAATIGFRFEDEAFVVDFGPEGIRTRRGEPEGCAPAVSTNPISLASVVYGGQPVLDPEAGRRPPRQRRRDRLPVQLPLAQTIWTAISTTWILMTSALKTGTASSRRWPFRRSACLYSRSRKSPRTPGTQCRTTSSSWARGPDQCGRVAAGHEGRSCPLPVSHRCHDRVTIGVSPPAGRRRALSS